MSREVSKITSRNSYKACVLSKVFLTQELSRTTNDVLFFLKKKSIFFSFYENIYTNKKVSKSNNHNHENITIVLFCYQMILI